MRRAEVLIAPYLVALAACGGAVDPDSASREQGLIGGTPAGVGEFDSALFLKNNWPEYCSGARVGPRHILTAAHCVASKVDGSVLAAYQPGQTIQFTQDKVLETATFVNATVYRTYIHASWKQACADGCPGDFTALQHPYPSDVAIIELRMTPDTFKNWGMARVSLTPVEDGAALVEVGYGCEEDQPLATRLKYHPATAKFFGPPLFHAHYILTDGKGANDAAAGLCDGDGGGPLYEAGVRPVIVGVNSTSWTPEGGGPFPTHDYHTRFDDSDPGKDVATFLKHFLPNDRVLGD